MSDWVLTSSIPDSSNKQGKTKPQSDWVLSDTKKEEGFVEKLPRNTAIGLANLGHSILNAPHDIIEALEGATRDFPGPNELFPIPNEIQKNIKTQEAPNLSQFIPKQQEYDFAKMLGQESEPTWADTLVQKGVEYAPEALLATNALRNVIPHLTKRGASKKLRQAKKLVSERNMAPLNVDPELIEDMRQFLPNTSAYRNALDAAHTGDYQKLFELQSDVGKESASKSRDLFSSAQRSHGRAGFKSVNALLDDMHKEIQGQGHHDISGLLKEGRNDYRRYKKFVPYRNAIALAGLGAIVPKNTLSELMKKLLFHSNQ